MSEICGSAQFAEDDLLALSALADIIFCERRAALHHTEGVWEDNPLTVEGTYLHDKVDTKESTEVRGDLRIARSLRLRSLWLGLSGKTDVVEFHLLTDAIEGNGVRLEGVAGRWQPVPVEYKRGKLHHEKGYDIQLCAQALCLEEMLECNVPAGAIYYGKTHRRLEVAFDAALRRETESASARLHQLIKSCLTPEPSFGPKCEHCSLVNLCLPTVSGSRRKVGNYLAGAFAQVEEADH